MSDSIMAYAQVYEIIRDRDSRILGLEADLREARAALREVAAADADVRYYLEKYHAAAFRKAREAGEEKP